MDGWILIEKFVFVVVFGSSDGVVVVVFGSSDGVDVVVLLLEGVVVVVVKVVGSWLVDGVVVEIGVFSVDEFSGFRGWLVISWDVLPSSNSK